LHDRLVDCTHTMAKSIITDERTKRCPVALLIIDVINDMRFPGAERLVRHALPMAHKLARLKARAAAAGIPAIYVNDNFGRWRSDFNRLIEYCTQSDVPGRDIARLLRPEPHDYFVLKPMHSAFFGTTLDVLLQHLGVRTVIVTGVAGNICVLFTANDAYMRGFRVYVPRDCVASNTVRENTDALTQMRTVVKATITASPRLPLADLIAGRQMRGRTVKRL
jgi:nicotinamidase-related amidase